MVRENLEFVREKISNAAKKAGNRAEDITLVAVTKTHPPELINEALGAGVTDIGENKVQEVISKFEAVNDARWHLIGHLQTNKVKNIVDKVSLIHSVDSLKLLDEIERQSKLKNIKSNVLIQINISGEETKFGINPEDTERILEYNEGLSNVQICGLMTIAPKLYEGVTNTKHFENIRRIFVDIGEKKYNNSNMRYLSMGMSGDFEEAIACGSNMVRIGSAIFGKRDYDKI